jgi:histidinol-phosphate/aromatic aminotransferase/cobyric acid decarboxylase-like protein
MKQEGIILRDRSSEVKLEGCIRITLGTALENRSVIAELKGVLS